MRWLHNAGARVRHLTQTPSQRELALSDGMVLTGAFTDLHAGLYGEVPRIARGEPDFERDRIDLGVLTAALAMDLPVLGVCRGHQLLNIASGGDLYQDVVSDGATTVEHGAGAHPVRTHAGAAMRSLLGRSAYVDSEHHQAIRRLGRGLRRPRPPRMGWSSRSSGPIAALPWACSGIPSATRAARATGSPRRWCTRPDGGMRRGPWTATRPTRR